MHNGDRFVHTDNKIWIWNQRNSLSNINIGILISIVAIMVDIYFFSSGCLATYLYLKNKTNKGQIESTDCRTKFTDLFIRIIKRFIRYVFVILTRADNEKRQCDQRNKIIALINIYFEDSHRLI